MSLARGELPQMPAGRPGGATGAPWGIHLSLDPSPASSLHASPLVRRAPWLVVVAVLFLLVFVPFGLMPEVARRAALGARLELARTSAQQAEHAAAEMARVAAELPALREELAREEAARMISLEELPGVGTALAAHARAAGVTLLSVNYGPYTRLAGGGDEDAARPAQAHEGEPSQEGEPPQVGAPSQPEKSPPARARGTTGLPYGRVSLEVTARGPWANLARFTGRLEAAMPGLRVTSWSARGEPGQETFQLHLSGLLYVAGVPPVPQAIGESPEGSQPSGPAPGQAGAQPPAQAGGQAGGPATGS
ncbi:MAG TPA: hypothetical protein VIK99_05205 [Thermaerobacter sp.]